MATRNVIKPFKLNTPKGVIEFEAGTQEIDDAILDHWFVKAHLEKPKAKSDAGSDEGEKSQSGGEGAAEGADDAKKAELNAKAGAGKKE